MSRLLRNLLVVAVAAAMAFCLAACSGSQSGSSENSNEVIQHETGKHIIGVAVYNVSDNEVMMFKNYLVEYVQGVCFEDVQFVYSESLNSEEELLEFIDEVAELGGEGIMSFYSIDLGAEVERCASHEMYLVMASGTVSEENFAKVADNEYFIGCFGPGLQMEYDAGADMARYFSAQKGGNRYFIMSGGAAYGNTMHLERAVGMLDALAEAYKVDLGDTRELALTTEVKTITEGDLTVTIAPGYVARENMRGPVEEAFKAGSYDYVLSTLPIAPILGTLAKSKAEIGQVDCYSQDNQLLFVTGTLDYVSGKYGSLIGPAFVAMYNAVTGHAADFRDDGKAFRIEQCLWTSTSDKDYEQKYEYASNVTVVAYNYEDLYSICAERNPDATLDDLVALATACSFEDVQARHANG